MKKIDNYRSVKGIPDSIEEKCARREAPTKSLKKTNRRKIFSKLIFVKRVYLFIHKNLHFSYFFLIKESTLLNLIPPLKDCFLKLLLFLQHIIQESKIISFSNEFVFMTNTANRHPVLIGIFLVFLEFLV
jgi:hypothetical protein